MPALLQYVTGWHQHMTMLSTPIHRALCRKHGLEFIVNSKEYSNGRMLGKIHTILEWMKSANEGDAGALIDADALWVAGEVSLAAALPFLADVGMVRNVHGQLNSGAIYFRNNSAAQALFEYAAAMPDLPMQQRMMFGMFDQGRINVAAAETNGSVVELDPRWNCYRYAAFKPTGSVIVRAWHGEPRQCALKAMRAAVAAMGMPGPAANVIDFTKP